MSEEKKVLMNPMTARSLALGVILSAVLTYILGQGWIIGHNSPLGLGNLNWPGASDPSAPQFQFFGPLLIIVAFMLLIPKKYRLNSAEIVFVLTCVVTVPTLTGDQGLGVRWMSTFSHHVIMYPTRTAEVLGNMSPLLWPKDTTVLDGMRYGTLTAAQIPWAAWTTPLMFQMALFIVLRLFFLFGSSILQEQFIDIEALPFPLETVNNEIINLTRSENSEKSGIWKNRTSKILALIGFVIALLWWLVMSPSIWYPAISFFSTNPLKIDLTPNIQVYAPLYFDFELSRWGWLFIMPIDVTLTFSITQIIFYYILPPTLVRAGQIRDWGLGRAGNWVTTREVFFNINTPTSTIFKAGYGPLFIGVMLGLAIVPLVIHRKHLIGSLRMAISGGYRGDFLSPRILWAGWALTGLAVVALFIATSIPIYYSFILLALISLWYLAMARTAAGLGLFLIPADFLMPQYAGVNAQFYSMSIFGLAPFNESVEAFNTAFVGNVFMNPANAGLMPSNQMMYNLEMFKLAELTNTDRRKMTVAMAINSILPVVIVLPLAVYLLYTQGGWQPRNVANTSRTIGETWSLIKMGYPGTGTYPELNMPWTLIFIVVGIAIVSSITFARAKFGGLLLYLSPIGLAWGLLGDMIIYFVGAIVVTIIRFIVMRVGGPRLYEEKVIPLAVGLLAFTGLQWILVTVLWVLRGMGYVWWAV